jgi:hypothetical protein
MSWGLSVKYSFRLLTALSLILPACASSGSGASTEREMNRVAALVVTKYPGKQVLIAKIEPARDYLSNKMALAAIKAGAETNDSQAIKDLLANRNVERIIVVTGVDDALSAATLERALLDGRGRVQGGRVVFVGSPEYTDRLRQVAAESGVQIEFLR